MATRKPVQDILTGKQKAFIVAYCSNGMNGVRAARSAGYAGSYSVLGNVASENLKNPKIRKAIDAHFKRIAMGKDEVLARLTEIARGDLGDVLNKDGTFDIQAARRRGKSYLIKEQKIEEKFIPQEGKDDIVIRTVTIKIHDAHAALNTLAKYHGMLIDRVKTEDWRSEAIDALRKGEITPDAARKEFGTSLAEELFREAGIKVNA